MRDGARVAASTAVAALVLAGACSGSGSGGRRGTGTAAGGRRVTTTTRALRHFSVAAAGDILLHHPVITDGRVYAHGRGYDFSPMFTDVRNVISRADLAVCHQETPISADDTALSPPGSLTFNAPHEIADALKGAGFDACDTASNHTWDHGLAGVQQTLDVLDRVGIGHAGSARSQQEADNPPIYDVNGVKVGHLAYSYTVLNSAVPDTSVPPEAPWLRSMLWPALGARGILDMAHALKGRGAEFVVISIHWGDQYVHQPNAQQRQLATELLTSPDVDLILGDHVHVVQPCEKIADKYVVYGMGNFLSNQSPTQDATLKVDSQDGSLETWTVEEVAPGRFRTTAMTYVPTWVVIAGHRVVPAAPDRYRESYARTVANMSLLGPGRCDARPEF